MDDALLRALQAQRRGVSPEMSQVPVMGRSVDPNAGMSAGIADAFNRVRDTAGKAIEYAPIAGIAKAIHKQALEDQIAGSEISMLGGKHLSGYGRQLTEAALERGKPFRPNAADTAYVHPETGDIIENPHSTQQRALKVAEFDLQRRLEEEKARLGRDLTEREKEATRQMMERLAGAKNTTNITIAQGHDEASKARAAGAGKGVGLPPKIAEEIGKVQAEHSNVERAITQAEANPGAFSLKKGLPGAVAGQLGETYTFHNLTDVQKKARAAVFNDVSSVIKSRAGTAVSQGEREILNRFLPTPYDEVPTIVAKFRDYQAHLKMLEAGHREAGRLTGKTAPTAPAVEDHSAGVAAEIARRNAQRKDMTHGR